jgi:hypothetical protein
MTALAGEDTESERLRFGLVECVQAQLIAVLVYVLDRSERYHLLVRNEPFRIDVVQEPLEALAFELFAESQTAGDVAEILTLFFF